MRRNLVDASPTTIIDIESRFGAYLSSRVTAARLRAQIEDLVRDQHVVLLDMTNVQSMSEGFADEAFAILLIERGAEWFKKSIGMQGLKAFVRDTILAAVLERRARLTPGSI